MHGFLHTTTVWNSTHPSFHALVNITKRCCSQNNILPLQSNILSKIALWRQKLIWNATIWSCHDMSKEVRVWVVTFIYFFIEFIYLFILPGPWPTLIQEKNKWAKKYYFFERYSSMTLNANMNPTECSLISCFYYYFSRTKLLLLLLLTISFMLA